MKKRIIATLMVLCMVMGCLIGCGSKKDDSDSDSKSSKGETFKILSIWSEDVDQGKMLNDLCNKYKKEVDPDFDFEIELVSSGDLNTKVATLMASNDLPDAFAYVAGQPLSELIENDKVVNISEELRKAGVEDKITDGTKSLLTELSGTDDIYDLPLGLNIEGFWYNKAVFEKAGVEVPTTWDELLDACDKLQAAGVQHLSAGGSDRWPLTRLVNAYIVRTLGTEAVEEALDGKKQFTDDEFVAAAQMLQDMADKGYFGKGVTTVDNTTAGNMVLSGEAAMCYNGSWFTQDITADTNPAGEEGIGFFSIPTVDESVSSATEIPMNCGNILCLSKDKYNDNTAKWLKFFVENAGDYGISEQGQVKGYQYDAQAEVSPINQLVNDAIDNCSKSALWLEARMNTETSSAAMDNAQLLVNGEMTAEQYMKSIQDAYELSK
ncbi:MAG: ABC transporter substrate-binding protein [Suipraeoptans sp.]